MWDVGTKSVEISVRINVPDGEFCVGCDLWYRSQDKKRCYCLLFGMVELDQRYKENVTGTDILKCAQCKGALLVKETKAE